MIANRPYAIAPSRTRTSLALDAAGDLVADLGRHHLRRLRDQLHEGLTRERVVGIEGERPGDVLERALAVHLGVARRAERELGLVAGGAGVARREIATHRLVAVALEILVDVLAQRRHGFVAALRCERGRRAHAASSSGGSRDPARAAARRAVAAARRLEDLVRVAAGVEPPQRQDLEQDRAERVDVGATIDLRSHERLLGRDVAGVPSTGELGSLASVARPCFCASPQSST